MRGPRALRGLPLGRRVLLWATIARVSGQGGSTHRPVGSEDWRTIAPSSPATSANARSPTFPHGPPGLARRSPCTRTLGQRTLPSAATASRKVENRQKKIPFRPVPFSILFRPCLYWWDPVSIFTKTREGFFHPYPWDPVFIRN
jgi:hypothetical protein